MDQQELQREREEWEGNIRLPIQISGSVFFVLDLVFVQSLIQASSLTGWKIFSLLLFVVALPCLAGNAFIMYRMGLKKTVRPGKDRLFLRLFLMIQLTGYCASFAGVWASIMDVSWWIGLLFALITIAVFFLCSKLNMDLEKIRTQQKMPMPH